MVKCSRELTPDSPGVDKLEEVIELAKRCNKQRFVTGAAAACAENDDKVAEAKGKCGARWKNQGKASLKGVK